MSLPSQANTKLILEYFRTCLADEGSYSRTLPDLGNESTPRLPRPDSATRQIVRADIVSGRIDPDSRDHFKAVHLRKPSTQKFEGASITAVIARKKPLTQIPLLLYPFVFLPKRSHNKVRASNKPLIPLAIPAVLDPKSGVLSPSVRQLPWIPRAHLEPTSSEFLVLGKLETLDRILAQYPPEIELSWSELIACAELLAKEFLDRSIVDPGQIDLDDYILREHACAEWYEGAPVGSHHILSTYQELRKHYRTPGRRLQLLETYCDPRALVRPVNTSTQKWNSSRHIAHIDPRYSLSQTQRVAIRALSEDTSMQFQAVNGPPGTGKTALLLACVANRWALGISEPSRKHAPIVVASSTNNQALANIQTNLAQALGDLGSRRWLPEPVTDLSLRFIGSTPGSEPPAPLAPKVKATDLRNHSGYWQRLCDPEFLSKAEAYFLERCRLEGIPYLDLDMALKSISMRMDSLRSKIATLPNLKEELQVLRENLERESESFPSVEARIESLRSRRQDLSCHLTNLKRSRLGWMRCTQEAPLRFILLSWLKPIRRAELERRRLKKMELESQCGISLPELHLHDFEPSSLRVQAELLRCLRTLKKDCARLNSEISRLETLHKCFRKAQKAFSALDEELSESRPPLPRDTVPLEECLDRKWRSDLFWLCVHYGEGVFLQRQLQMPLPKLKTDDQAREQLRRLAWLHPLWVSTLHLLPAFFKSSEDHTPSFEWIDLLVIDEAAQVAPHIVGPSLCLTKSVIAIGDEKQIEPVVTLPLEISRRNFDSAKLAHQPSRLEFNELDTAHLDSRRSNFLGRVKELSHFTSHPNFGRGLLLTEHRRCFRSIINYCNELSYENCLQMLRADPDKSQDGLPLLGYAHVWGGFQSGSDGRSRSNKSEVRAVLSWIHHHKAQLHELYSSKSLGEVVGIITPYRDQRQEFERQLKTFFPALSETTIPCGTVHAFQGSEKPVIIFSPVISSKMDSNFLSENMLNVAVSRAKDSFLVFGDMSLFNPDSGPRQLRLLGKHLFRSPRQELSGFPSHVHQLLEADPPTHLERIQDLNRHREFLKESLLGAQKRVCIFSPFISANAIQDDAIDDWVRIACARGVNVSVVTDAYLNHGHFENFESGCRLLRNAGAELRIESGIHQKTLIVDNHLLAEGSFNWLSASRREGIFQRDEATLVIRGERARHFIEKTGLFELMAKTRSVSRPPKRSPNAFFPTPN